MRAAGRGPHTPGPPQRVWRAGVLPLLCHSPKTSAPKFPPGEKLGPFRPLHPGPDMRGLLVSVLAVVEREADWGAVNPGQPALHHVTTKIGDLYNPNVRPRIRTGLHLVCGVVLALIFGRFVLEFQLRRW